MSSKRLSIAILLAIVLLVITSAVVPQAVYAQCGGPGMPPCSTGGDKRKVATRTPLPTNTAIELMPIVPVMPLPGGAASTPTLPPLQLTAIAQIKTAIALTTTPTPSITPTSNPLVPPPSNRPIVTPVAGPVLLLPGTAVVIIIVALIALLVAGGVFLMRRFSTPGTQRPPNPNQHQGPGG